MKDSIRRIVLFVAIVGIGSAMILVNIPVIYMLLLIVVVGFLLLFLLGAITTSDLKNTYSKLNISRIRKQPVSGKPNPKQIPEKNPPAKKEAGKKKDQKSALDKSLEKSRGISAHLSLLVSSVGSMGKILTDRKKPRKKVEDIDKLLEHTITEKVSKSSALESAGAVPAAAGSSRNDAGGGLPNESGKETDPFLSLSGEELEMGLLDGLDEQELSPSSTDSLSELPVPDSGISLPDMEMPPLPDDSADDANAILAAHAEENSEELPSLEGAESLGGSISDLDKINLDEIDLGDDSGMLEEESPQPLPQASGPAPGSGSLIPATPITPAGVPEADDQSDISSFASGNAPGTDEDMLSSLASDVKSVKKEQNVSLLRELKDFKAPATDIEKELSEISVQFNNAINNGAKKRPIVPVKGKK
jgi:ERCC4-type nuclease